MASEIKKLDRWIIINPDSEVEYQMAKAFDTINLMIEHLNKLEDYFQRLNDREREQWKICEDFHSKYSKHYHDYLDETQTPQPTTGPRPKDRLTPQKDLHQAPGFPENDQ